MFNFFKPSPEPYLNLMNLILYSWGDTFPLTTVDQKVAIITCLVNLAHVDGIPSKNKIMFIELFTSSGRKGIWGIDKEKHPVWQLPDQFPFWWVKKHLKSLQPNNKAKFFMLLHALTNVIGNQGLKELIYILKIVEEIGSTHEEYYSILSKEDKNMFKLKQRHWK